jgi:hypothetical protein
MTLSLNSQQQEITITNFLLHRTWDIQVIAVPATISSTHLQMADEKLACKHQGK